MHRLPLRVYYEDVDLAGVVYYANYLRFYERGRSEAIRALGVDQTAMRAADRVFVVTRIEADYLRPARFDDLIEVTTRTLTVGGASLTMAQEILRGAEVLNRAVVRAACMDLAGRPARFPPEVRARLRADLDAG